MNGGDYMTEVEAAYYSCCGLTHFRRTIGKTPGLAKDLHRKKIYRKVDLQREIEARLKTWSQNNAEETPGFSGGENQLDLPMAAFVASNANSVSETSRQSKRNERERLNSWSSRQAFESATNR